MQDLNNKIDNAGATADGKLPSAEWNEVASELQNVIESSSLVLSSGDVQQLVKAISDYCTVGDFYTGAGVVNTYTATVIAPMIAPDSLKVGMKIRTIIPITNTGNSTLNAFGSGVIDIKKPGDIAISPGELIAATEYEFIYRESPTTHWEVLDAGIETVEGISLAGLDYPTIDTTDNRITATPAFATNGGTVSIPADVLVSLAQELTTGETGIMAAFKTPAFTSIDLDISSTYYLRAHFISGVITVYMQKGTDADTIPAGLIGTPGGASGGGFDCTVLDVLFAKVVTDTAGTVPTVTELANNKDLIVTASVYISNFPQSRNWSNVAGSTIILDWARSPEHKTISLSMLAGHPNKPDGSSSTHSINMCGIRYKAGATTRYETGDYEQIYEDTQTSSAGSGQIEYFLMA